MSVAEHKFAKIDTALRAAVSQPVLDRYYTSLVQDHSSKIDDALKAEEDAFEQCNMELETKRAKHCMMVGASSGCSKYAAMRWNAPHRKNFAFSNLEHQGSRCEKFRDARNTSHAPTKKKANYLQQIAFDS